MDYIHEDINPFVISFVIVGLEMAASRFIVPTFGSTVYTLVSLWGISTEGVAGRKSSSHMDGDFIYI